MSAIASPPLPTPADLVALSEAVASKADKTAIPKPASAAPLSDAIEPAAGAKPTEFALADHQHKRPLSSTYVALDANGKAKAMFSRPFTNKPTLNLTETDAADTSQPLTLRGQGWEQDAAGLYIGVNIRGMRAQTLPAIGQISIASLLGATTAGVNAISTALGGFNVFGGGVAGASVSVIAVARSDVAST